jgi:hypothetical protein
MIGMVDVTLQRSGDSLLMVKLQSATWEVNIRASAEDLGRLADIRDADWETRRSLRVGTSAGAPVHWAMSDDQAVILIGHDDETWDIAVTVPVTAVEEIASLTRQQG